MKSIRSIGIVVVAVALASACGKTSSAQELGRCPDVAKMYFSDGIQAATNAMRTTDLETKYQIYLCGNQYMHPPALYLAAEYAREGIEVVGFLKEKLASTKSDATVRDIIRVFVEMDHQGTFEVADDSDTKRLLRARCDRVSDQYWRDYCSGLLEGIGLE